MESCQLAGFDLPQADKSLVGFIAFQNQIRNQRNALPRACSIHGKSRLIKLQEGAFWPDTCFLKQTLPVPVGVLDKSVMHEIRQVGDITHFACILGRAYSTERQRCQPVADEIIAEWRMPLAHSQVHTVSVKRCQALCGGNLQVDFRMLFRERCEPWNQPFRCK